MVARSIVEIDIPTMVATHAVMANDCGGDGVQRHKRWIFSDPSVHFLAIGAPIPISAPAIEGAVISRFKDGVEYIIVSNYMAAPSPVPDVDAGAGHVINTVVTHCNPSRHRDFYSSRLLFDRSNRVN